jgi:hypothetical protein
MQWVEQQIILRENNCRKNNHGYCSSKDVTPFLPSQPCRGGTVITALNVCILGMDMLAFHST